MFSSCPTFLVCCSARSYPWQADSTRKMQQMAHTSGLLWTVSSLFGCTMTLQFDRMNINVKMQNYNTQICVLADSSSGSGGLA